jgi:hypothetical protein
MIYPNVYVFENHKTKHQRRESKTSTVIYKCRYTLSCDKRYNITYHIHFLLKSTRHTFYLIASNKRGKLNFNTYSPIVACGLWVTGTLPWNVILYCSSIVHKSVCWISPIYLYQLNYNHVFL